MDSISRRSFIGIMCTAGALFLTSCGSQKKDVQNAVNYTAESASGGNEQIANPFNDCATMEDAAAIAGFSMLAPDTAAGLPLSSIQAVDKSMIQLEYTDEVHEVTLRKAVGTEDVSGDYTEYAEINTLENDGSTVTIKGHDGLAFTVTWSVADFSYAILSDAGIASNDVVPLINSIG